jgi:hypothetical protein
MGKPAPPNFPQSNGFMAGRQRRAAYLLKKITQRRQETLPLYMALPAVEQFHASMAKWRVLDGSNQSSKTTAAAVEIIRACCGCDPYDKYPKRDGKVLCVGLDGDHLASPMFSKMYEPGAIKLIRDEHTRLMRAVRPNPNDPTVLDPYDEAYKEKWVDAPPLIPKRLLESIAWEHKGKIIPRLVKFKTGWKQLWRSSKSDSPQGDWYNIGWFDEQLENEDFYRELNRGLMKAGNQGFGIWSATPQTSNEQLLDLREKAEAGVKGVLAVRLQLDDNPHISKESKKEFWDTLSDEEREVCYFGQYAIVGRRIYGLFNIMGEHGCDPFPIPEDYTRYIILDPGQQYCGTLFAAVDPDEKHVYIYDGFVLRHADAGKWGDMIAKRTGNIRYEAMIIDQQCGRQKTVGQARTVADHYFSSLKERNITPRISGEMSGFHLGTNDVEARELALLDWMRVRGGPGVEGTCKVQIMRGVLDKLCKQIRRAQYERKRPEKRKTLEEDLLVCLEYLAGFQPYYFEPEVSERASLHPVFDKLKAKRKRIKQAERNAELLSS